ncbi:MAG: alpha-amylase family glycosyl hydrolase [Mucilaginibacter sp.]
MAAAADSTFQRTPADKQQIIFIENHDTPRFSFGVNGDVARLKIGAALNLLLGGIPSIYYGQELGMTGTSAKLGATDANEIPNREAFEWYKSDKGKGMAYWYKKKGPWKDQFNNNKPDDGVSLEEEQNEPSSLWNFYRVMIGLRKSNPVLINGIYKTLVNNNDKVFSFERAAGNKRVIVIINLSDKAQDVAMPFTSNLKDLKKLYGSTKPELSSNTITMNMPAYDIEVWDVK